MRGIIRGGYCLFAHSPISALFASPDHCPVESLQKELQKILLFKNILPGPEGQLLVALASQVSFPVSGLVGDSF